MSRINLRFMTLLLLVVLNFHFLSSCSRNQSGMTDGIEASYKNANSALSHTKKFGAEVSTSWFNLLANISRTTPLIPAPSIRLFSYNAMAMYEAVVPGMPSYQSMYTYLTGDVIEHDKKKDYYWPAAANAAMARITSLILQNYAASPNLGPVLALEAANHASYAAQATPEQLTLSVNFGRMVADKIYEWAKTDGTLQPNGALAPCPPYVLQGTPGSWVPTPPSFPPAAGACQGNLRSFVPNIANLTLPPPPPAYSTATASQFYQAANEIYQISLSLTPQDSMLSRAWRDLVGTNYNTPAHMIKVTTEILQKEKPDLEKAALIYAQQTIAMNDAIISVFKAKFHYHMLRPITYIRNVMGHSNWNTVIPTPQHPAYPSTVVAASSSALTVLENHFGKSYSFSDSTQHSLYGTWNYPSFQAYLEDIGRSRTHSGINFRFTVDAAIEQGRQVGTRVLGLPFRRP